MINTKLRQVFNRAVTDISFRNKLLDNMREVLVGHGVAEEMIVFIEAHDPPDIQTLALVLQKIDDHITK